MDKFQELFEKKDIQKKFQISLATVNNWIKTGIIPSPTNGFYTKEVFEDLIKSIETNMNKLHSRANRSFKNSSTLVYLGIKDKKRKTLLENLVKQFETTNISVKEAVVCLGKQILQNNNLYNKDSEIYEKLNQTYNGTNFFHAFYIENKNDDILGAFYQSIQSIANKSKDGSFYTPAEILKYIKIPVDSKVLDPCCGSGSILINTLSEKHNPSSIYAFDTDETALLICHINLILFFNNEKITPHIEKHDLIFSAEKNLFTQNDEKFDFIITNPPWGSKLSKKQKDFLLANYPLNTTEVFSISLYNAINKLTKNGQLYFYLPESILNVSTHKNIRKYLLQCNRNIEIIPLGMAFKGVQSECVLLKLSEYTEKEICIILGREKKYFLDKKNIKAPDFFISYTLSEVDERILNKIYSAKSTKLSENTEFALGIVTGNNKKYIHDQKQDNEEPIFRGKDILPYKLKSPESFINFTPEIFQQVAQTEKYRTKKIIYKFISDKITCSLNVNSLVLNSANLIISHDYPMEILVCLFNSPIYSFIYQKKFKSKKVLKQHFKDFPLPILDEALKEKLFLFYETALCEEKIQDKIDKEICKYFGITKEEYTYIKEYISGNTEK